jgi:hypothetical protein
MPHRKSSRNEVALLDRSGHLPPETSPEDLKIRALERATAFLNVQIQEVQERTEQLRRYLADQGIQPGERQGYQREKWRADRRLAALRVLIESTRAVRQPVSKHSEDQMTSVPARKQANLSSFFQRGSRKAPLPFNCVVAGKAQERRVLKQVSPLLLKPSIPSSWTQSFLVQDNVPPLYAHRRHSERITSMTSTQEGPQSPSSTSYSATEGTLTSSLSPKTLPDDNFGTTHDGVALILSPILRSNEEIIAEMGDIALPAYAFNLLEDLDYIHDKIRLRPDSSSLYRSSSPFLVTPSDWEYPPRDPSIVSPRRTATVRIPDRHLADALLSSPETESTPRKRRLIHKVSLDPAFFKDDSRSDKLGEVAPPRRSLQVPGEEGGRKPKGLLKRKTSVVISIVSRGSDKRGEPTPSTPRKNIASMVKRRIATVNKFR